MLDYIRIFTNKKNIFNITNIYFGLEELEVYKIEKRKKNAETEFTNLQVIEQKNYLINLLSTFES